jgi:DNA-binding response OmpR family regulator
MTIIALTGTLTDKEQVIKCLQAGMSDCIVKPLDAENIKAHLEKLSLLLI